MLTGERAVNMSSFGTTLDAVGYHDQLAGSWEQRYEKPSFQARLAVLAECLEGRDLSGTEWLDAGCGTGTLSRWLADQGCTVLGVDAAPQMISTAGTLTKSRATHGVPRFELVRTIASLPLSSHSTDGILCSSVLEYVPDPEACLTEFARVLRPGGILLVSLPNAGSLIRRSQIGYRRLGQFFGKNWVAYLSHSKNQYSSSQFEPVLLNRGFGLERVLPFGGPIPRWIQRTQTLGPLLMFRAKKL
jgi:2-polyprenyl-6-hydroxyphenyl methylase/3-demethylubiquinone-9 3-methyltransferase